MSRVDYGLTDGQLFFAIKVVFVYFFMGKECI